MDKQNMFEFESRQQEAQSYRKTGFSYYQIADLMGISTKQVWMNLKGNIEGRDLTGDEMYSAVDKVGIPRGKGELKPSLEIDRYLEASFLAALTFTNGVCPYCKEQVYPIEDFNMRVDIERGREHSKLHKKEYAKTMEMLGL